MCCEFDHALSISILFLSLVSSSSQGGKFGLAFRVSVRHIVLEYHSSIMPMNFVRVFLQFFLLLITSYSEENFAYYLEWDATFHGTVNTYGKEVAVHEDGSIYILFVAVKSMDTDPSSCTKFVTSDTTFSVVVKLDRNGSFLWSSNVKGGSQTQPSGLALDTSGNSYVAGFMGMGNQVFDSIPVASQGGMDLFVWKLDVNGNTVWAKGVGPSASQYARDIAVDPSGNVYVTGEFYSSIEFGDGFQLTCADNCGRSKLFVWKMDSNGNTQWAVRVDTNGGDVQNAARISVDSVANVHVVGSFKGSVCFDPPACTTVETSTDTASFVWKLDTNKNHLWVVTSEQPSLSFVSTISKAMALGADGAVYVAGLCQGTIDFTCDKSRFVLKLQANGDFAWASNTDLDARGVAVDLTGNVYMTGKEENGMVATVSRRDAVTGDITTLSLNGNGTSLGQGIAVDPASKIYVTGRFEGTAGWSDLSPSMRSIDPDDGFLLKLSPNQTRFAVPNADCLADASASAARNAVFRLAAVVQNNGFTFLDNETSAAVEIISSAVSSVANDYESLPGSLPDLFLLNALNVSSSVLDQEDRCKHFEQLHSAHQALGIIAVVNASSNSRVTKSGNVALAGALSATEGNAKLADVSVPAETVEGSFSTHRIGYADALLECLPFNRSASGKFVDAASNEELEITSFASICLLNLFSAFVGASYLDRIIWAQWFRLVFHVLGLSQTD